MKQGMRNGFWVLGLMVCVVLGGCGKTKEVVNMSQETPKSESVISEGTGDTDEYFEALGIAYGPRVQMGNIHILALENAQEIIRRKMASVYKSVVEEYMVEYGLNKDTDIEKKMESMGKQFINTIVNDTREVGMPEFSTADEQGNVRCIVLARMYKKGFVEQMTNYLFEDEETKRILKENLFRQILGKRLEKK